MTRENADMLRSFAKQMRETARGYASELLAENLKLVEIATTLHAANARLSQEVSDFGQLRAENRELRGLLDTLTLEHQKTCDELAELRSSAERDRDAVVGRAWQLAEVSQKTRELAARFSEVDRCGEQLANWLIVLGRLHEATSPAHVVSLLGEVLRHLVGTQRFAIFTATAGGEAMRLASSFGVDASLVERLPTLTGRVAGASRGSAYLRSAGDESMLDAEGELSACFPLRAHGLTLGVVAIFDWNASAPTARAPELETLSLLVKHGGTALLTCQLLSALNAMQTAAA
jgi:hypothetical protein